MKTFLLCHCHCPQSLSSLLSQLNQSPQISMSLSSTSSVSLYPSFWFLLTLYVFSLIILCSFPVNLLALLLALPLGLWLALFNPVYSIVLQYKQKVLGLKACARIEPHHNWKQIFPVNNAISGFTVWSDILQQKMGWKELRAAVNLPLFYFLLLPFFTSIAQTPSLFPSFACDSFQENVKTLPNYFLLMTSAGD